MLRMAAVAILSAASLLAPGAACKADERRQEHAWLPLAEGWAQLLLCHPRQGEPPLENPEPAFEKAIALDRSCTWAYVGLGWWHAQIKLWCLADDDFSRAIEIEPHSAVLRYLRASLYYRQHRLEEALADCEAALQLAPRVAPLHLLEAALHWARKDYDRSLAACQRTLELCPTNADAHLLRGMLYGRKGNLDAALADMSCALERAPFAFGYKLRARTWLRKWSLEAAVADLDRAVRLDPRDIEALVLRSGIQLVRRHYKDAIADCDQALRVNPSCGAAYANRGAARFKQGERDSALADFDRAIRIDSHDLDSLGNRAQLYGKMGEWDKVIADCTAILRHKPGWKKYRQLRLNAFLQSGVPASAWGDLACLLGQAQTSDASGYRERGDLYMLAARLNTLTGSQIGQAEENLRRALHDYDRAIELEPKCAQGYCKRAAVRLELGSWAEAIEDSSKALELDPRSKEAYIVLLLEHKAMHFPERALSYCKQLIDLCGDKAERRQWVGERACLEEDVENLGEAEASYSEYIHLDPQDPEGWQRRAAYFSRQGNERQAVQDLDHALRLQHGKAAPEAVAGLHLQRARLLIRTGDLQSALEDYSALVRLLPHWSKLHFERALLLAVVGDYAQAIQSGWRGCRLVLEHSLRRRRATSSRHGPARGETSGPATAPESAASSATGWLR